MLTELLSVFWCRCHSAVTPHASFRHFSCDTPPIICGPCCGCGAVKWGFLVGKCMTVWFVVCLLFFFFFFPACMVRVCTCTFVLALMLLVRQLAPVGLHGNVTVEVTIATTHPVLHVAPITSIWCCAVVCVCARVCVCGWHVGAHWCPVVAVTCALLKLVAIVGFFIYFFCFRWCPLAFA